MIVKGKEIEGIIPHRKPFIFVDEVETLPGGHVKAKRLFHDDEMFFSGHFPGYPVVPGVILVETLAQAGGVGVVIQSREDGNDINPNGDKVFFLASVNDVKFRRQVRPLETMLMEIKTHRASQTIIKQSGKGFVNGELAVEASWLCIYGPSPLANSETTKGDKA
ncbi:3-hydroxyacyl-ACP dehydratase FabZ [Spirochaetota bacterium]